MKKLEDIPRQYFLEAIENACTIGQEKFNKLYKVELGRTYKLVHDDEEFSMKAIAREAASLFSKASGIEIKQPRGGWKRPNTVGRSLQKAGFVVLDKATGLPPTEKLALTEKPGYVLETDDSDVFLLHEARRLANRGKAELAARLSVFDSGPASTEKVLSFRRKRNAVVRAIVLARAMGRCEARGCLSPFRSIDNHPYLEVHHIDRLADDRMDHQSNMAGLCPNCHREIHFGVDGKKTNKKLKLFVNNLAGTI